MIRQGDIFLKKIENKPNLSGLKQIHAPLILGYGEATGHRHQIKRGAKIFANDRQSLELFAISGGDFDIFIEVSESTELLHEEHGPIELSPGWYKPIRQREYSPERLRYVTD